MKSKVMPYLAVFALVATLVACGGGQDAEEGASSSDTSGESMMSSARDEAEQTLGETAASAEDAVDTAGNRMEEAGDRAAGMAGEVRDQAREMADQAGEQAREMADEAGDQMEAMAHEAGDQAEEAMAGAAAAMSGSDGDDASGADSGDPCVINVGVGDSIAYSVDGITVPSSCESVTINMEHTGSLPKEAMGHNWVLVPADAVQEIGMAGMSAGMESGYLPDDDRIVAATDLIGGGESTSVSFSLDELEAGTDYAYVCTFPGHWSAMRGPFTVE